LDPDEWAILRRVTDVAKGAEPGPVLEMIENALRADQAKMIEASSYLQRRSRFSRHVAGTGSLLACRLRRLHFLPVWATSETPGR
jgi:hypothetical protein